MWEGTVIIGCEVITEVKLLLNLYSDDIFSCAQLFFHFTTCFGRSAIIRRMIYITLRMRVVYSDRMHSTNIKISQRCLYEFRLPGYNAVKFIGMLDDVSEEYAVLKISSALEAVSAT
jgi:hypothetical protein